MNNSKSQCYKHETILDSKHILTTNIKGYNLKVIECGSYVQVYFYSNSKIKILENNDDFELSKSKVNLLLIEENDKKDIVLSNNIEFRSIIRSKLECQRLAKSNMNEWKTFITLTFKDNISDVSTANKKFRNYIDIIKRVKNDFKYIGIPEFQKRGAIHYHLLTNIECDSIFIPRQPLKKLYNPSSKTWKELEYYNLKYWNNGFSSAEPMNKNCKKVVGYISKYMTKDIDNRLFNRHRYFFSRNLNCPKTNFIDLGNKRDNDFYKKIIQDKELIYQNEYINPYDNNKVSFLEFIKK